MPKRPSTTEAQALLDEKRSLLGGDHPETLAAMVEMARLHRARGEYIAARALLEEAVSSRRRLFGDQDLETLKVLHLLAMTVYDLDDRVLARQMQTVVLEGLRGQLGSTHAATGAAMVNLATTLRHLCDGRSELEELETLEEQIVFWRRGSLGDDHPDTLRSLSTLAKTKRLLGENDAAQAIEREVRHAKVRAVRNRLPLRRSAS
jgi:uncharacterized protein (DUF2267 family)